MQAACFSTGQHGHGHEHRLRPWHMNICRLSGTTWFLDINLDLSHTRATDPHTALQSTVEHSGALRKSNLESGPFISSLCHCQFQGDSMSRRLVWGLHLHLLKLRPAAHPSLALSLTTVTSRFLPLSTAHVHDSPITPISPQSDGCRWHVCPAQLASGFFQGGPPSLILYLT